MRGEFTLVEAGFAKLPTLSGNGSLPLFVNSGATALEAVSAATARTRLGLAVGSAVEAWSAQLDALAALGSNGIVARTAANTVSARTITGTANEVTLTNGDGVSGNPTVSLPAALTFTGKTVTGGTFSAPTITGPTISGTVSGGTYSGSTLINPDNTLQALADAATVAWDASLGAFATLTLTAARIIGAPTNLKKGHYVLILTSGGFTPTWNAVFKGVNGGGMPAPGASGVTVYQFESDGTNLYLASMPIFTTLTNTLGADVNLNNTGTFFDGPSAAQGTVGVWLAIANLQFTDTAGTANYQVRLTDGTTVVLSATALTTGGSGIGRLSVAGVFTNPAGNIRVQMKDVTSTSGKIQFNQSGDSKDSSITVVRIG